MTAPFTLNECGLVGSHDGPSDVYEHRANGTDGLFVPPHRPLHLNNAPERDPLSILAGSYSTFSGPALPMNNGPKGTGFPTNFRSPGLPYDSLISSIVKINFEIDPIFYSRER